MLSLFCSKQLPFYSKPKSSLYHICLRSQLPLILCLISHGFLLIATPPTTLVFQALSNFHFLCLECTSQSSAQPALSCSVPSDLHSNVTYSVSPFFGDCLKSQTLSTFQTSFPCCFFPSPLHYLTWLLFFYPLSLESKLLKFKDSFFAFCSQINVT